MDAFFMTAGSISIPLGFWLVSTAPQLKYTATTQIIGALFALLGLILWIAAYLLVRNKEKAEVKEKVSRSIGNELFAQALIDLQTLTKEIKEQNRETRHRRSHGRTNRNGDDN